MHRSISGALLGSLYLLTQFKAASAEPTATYSMHAEQKITGWAISKDSSMLAVGSFGGIAQIWDLAHGSSKVKCTFDAGRAGWGIGGLTFVDSDSRLLGGCDDQKIRFWTIDDGKIEGTGNQPGGNGVTGAASTPDGMKVVLIDGNQTAYLAEVFSNKKTKIFAPDKPDGGQPRMGIALSKDGKMLVLASESNEDRKGWVEIWNTESHKRLNRLRSNGRCVSDVGLSSDSKTLLAGWDEAAMRLYRTVDGSSIREFSLPGYKKNPHLLHWEMTSLALSPDGKLASAGFVGGHLLIWNASSGSLLHQWKAHQGDIDHLSFTPNGRLLISADQGVINVWDRVNLEKGEAKK